MHTTASTTTAVPNGTPACEILGVTWTKPWSNSQGNCVEMAELATGEIGVRNSRFPDGPALVYTRAEIAALVAGVRLGQLDHITG